MMQSLSTIGLSVALLVISPVISAQKNRIEATIDSSAILVGHQTRVKTALTTAADQPSYRPLVADTLTDGVEVLEISPFDTLSRTEERIALEQKILVTSFDSGFYYLPPIRYTNGIDTIESNGLSLKVMTLDVDTANAEFFDIKTVQTPPFVWKDYLYLLWIFLAIAVLVALGYLFYRYKKNKPLLKPMVVEPYIPPHERALAALTALKAEKLWQNGKEKEYYTRITDILRIYLEERFSVNAMEKTTAEILNAFKSAYEDKSLFAGLKEILETADFVKFAKMRPTEEENEMSMMHALLFVNQTKIEEPKEDESLRQSADSNSEKPSENENIQ